MCCGIDHWKDYAPHYEKPTTVVYRLVNERIVGRISVEELNKNHYYESESPEDKKDYTQNPQKTSNRTQTPASMSTQQETLLSLIERARKQQEKNISWQ